MGGEAVVSGVSIAQVHLDEGHFKFHVHHNGQASTGFVLASHSNYTDGAEIQRFRTRGSGRAGRAAHVFTSIAQSPDLSTLPVLAELDSFSTQE